MTKAYKQRCQPHSLTKLTIFKIWQEDFEVGRKILRKCISWDCWLKNHDPSPRVSFFLTAQLRHYSPFWKLFNLLTAPVYCGCCALIGSLLTWPWLALKIDITASLDSGPLSFSLCTVLNEKGDRGTVWKRIKRAEDFEFSSTGDFAIERKNGRNYVERKIFRPKWKGWQLCTKNRTNHINIIWPIHPNKLAPTDLGLKKRTWILHMKLTWTENHHCSTALRQTLTAINSMFSALSLYSTIVLYMLIK